VSEVARVLGVDESELQREAGIGATGSGRNSSPGRVERKAVAGSAEMLLVLIATYPEIAEKAAERGVIALLPEELVLLAEEILAESMQKGAVDLSLLLERADPHKCDPLLAALFMNDAQFEGIDPYKAFEQCCASLERRPLINLRELARELARTEPETPRYHELLEEIDTLRNKKSQLS
jgi:DNA primase